MDNSQLSSRQQPGRVRRRRAAVSVAGNSDGACPDDGSGTLADGLAENRLWIDRQLAESGALLILDNIRTGHGRLNVEGSRRIAAGLGDLYSVEHQAAVAA